MPALLLAVASMATTASAAAINVPGDAPTITIRNGIAEAASPGNRGGGIYCNLTSPTIRDCIFIQNRATQGGAFYANGGTPTLIGCQFISNTATTVSGLGGAVFLNNSILVATDCGFLENVAVGNGGAVRGTGNSRGAFTRCDFVFNTGALVGGAIEIATGATAYTFLDCRFLNNVANGNGGAVQIVSANTVNHQFINCVFDQNTSGANGGAIQISGRAELINCTVTRNTAFGNGGAILTSGSGIALVRNGIVWENSPNGVIGPNLTVTYTCHQSAIAGAGNIVADPMFVSLIEGDLRLTKDSPCIDAGNTTLLPSTVATDNEGMPRAVNVEAAPTGIAAFGYFIDMGAFEYPAAPTPPACLGDLNGDGVVNGADLGILLSAWGFCR